MITVRNQANAQVFLCLKLPRLEDVLGDSLNILRGRCNIATLAACAVLDKDKVSVFDQVSDSGPA
jgi:hypothetical protein